MKPGPLALVTTKETDPCIHREFVSHEFGYASACSMISPPARPSSSREILPESQISSYNAGFLAVNPYFKGRCQHLVL